MRSFFLLFRYVYQRDSHRICLKFYCKFVSCFKQCGIVTDMIPCCSYVIDKDNHARQVGIKYIYGLVIVSLQPKQLVCKIKLKMVL